MIISVFRIAEHEYQSIMNLINIFINFMIIIMIAILIIAVIIMIFIIIVHVSRMAEHENQK